MSDREEQTESGQILDRIEGLLEQIDNEADRLQAAANRLTEPRPTEQADENKVDPEMPETIIGELSERLDRLNRQVVRIADARDQIEQAV